MRVLRLALAGVVTLALLGLLGVGPVAAADGVCQPEKSLADLYADEAKARAELVAAEDEVARLLMELLSARNREALAKASLAEATDCYEAKKTADNEATEPPDLAGTQDVPGWGVRVPYGDEVRYRIRCRGWSTDDPKGEPTEVPPRHAANYKELLEQIKEHPNGCISDEYYTRELIIVPFTQSGDGEWVEGRPIPAPIRW